MDDIVPQRQCLDCKDFFPPTTDYFYKSPRGREGLGPYCKPCHHARAAWNKQKPEVKAKAQSRKKLYYQAHKEQAREWHGAWYEANREQTLEKDRQFRKEHPEILAQRWQNWYQTENGKEHCRSRVRNRQARRKGADGNFTHTDILAQHKAQKGRCYYCQIKLIEYHVDHIVPIIRGGSNEPSNLVLACPHCNMSKGTKLLSEWQQGGRLI
jgi:5-methylcytosine-specific restriction endonuclease McrA